MYIQPTTAIVRIAPRPVHPMLVAAPIMCFAGALVTDIAYAATSNIMWSDFSDWLLAFAIGFGVIAFIAALVNVLASREIRAARPVWPFLLGGLIVLAVGFLNNLVHSRDAWTSVVPEGLGLSALTLVLILLTGWAAAAAARRQTLQPVEIRR